MRHQAWPQATQPCREKLYYLELEGQQGAEAGLGKGAAVAELPEVLT